MLVANRCRNKYVFLARLCPSFSLAPRGQQGGCGGGQGVKGGPCSGIADGFVTQEPRQVGALLRRRRATPCHSLSLGTTLGGCHTPLLPGWCQQGQAELPVGYWQAAPSLLPPLLQV